MPQQKRTARSILELGLGEDAVHIVLSWEPFSTVGIDVTKVGILGHAIEARTLLGSKAPWG